LLAQRRSLF
jgi:hypothetical protein